VGTPPPSSSHSSPSSETPSDSSLNESDAAEKWLVRILLVLAFGLAFGIEGMTLIRSFLIEETDATEKTTNARPVLEEGVPLAPSLGPSVRAHRLRLQAYQDEWIFTLTARPDTLADRSHTVTFNQLTLGNGTALTTAPSHTWAPSDTASFDASWTLPVGRRPQILTVTATTKGPSDSTASATRTVDLGHVPVRQQ
jgi:hypothetical protein